MAPRTTDPRHRHSSSTTGRRLSDSAQLQPPARSKPEDKWMSVMIVASVGTGLAGVLTYLAMGAR